MLSRKGINGRARLVSLDFESMYPGVWVSKKRSEYGSYTGT